MAKVRVMYWKEIPVQVQAEDESGQVSEQLDPRFQEAVDAISMVDGSSGTDDYLEAWVWGGYLEVPGTAADAAKQLAERFNKGFPEDFVLTLARKHRSGQRTPTPGALDHWANEG